MSTEYVTETLSANLSDRLAVCRAEVAKLREENERLLAANRYSLGMFNMLNADYQKLRAENDRYRAALVEIARRGIVEPTASYWAKVLSGVRSLAIEALATSTESGPLSDDSGPIAEAGK